MLFRSVLLCILMLDVSVLYVLLDDIVFMVVIVCVVLLCVYALLTILY
jgi:hypothetical protein